MIKISRAGARFAISALVGCTSGVALAETSPSPQPSCSNERVSEGCGTYRFPDGTTYVGGFHGGYPDGHGAITFADGSRLEDASQVGILNADAVYTDAQGKRLVGR